MPSEWTIPIGALCTLVGAVIGYVVFLRNRDKDAKAEGREDGAIMSELGYIKGGVDDLKKDMREQRTTNTQILERLTNVEASAKQAHKRLDRIEGKEGNR